jgi:hypothetical protein
MTRKNPESVATTTLRTALEARGAWTVKISDSFTRGVPDLQVVFDRVVLVEVKVLRRRTDLVTPYSALGLSGAQDHHIRVVVRRTGPVLCGACVVTTGPDSEAFRMWLPVTPALEGPGHEMYMMHTASVDTIARSLGWDGVWP